MWVVRPTLTFLAAFTFSYLIATAAEAADPQVVVQLASGRQFQGVIDPASDSGQLVLRTTSEGITLWRHIRWQRVERATLDGQPTDAAKLREIVQKERRQGTGEKRGGTLLRKIELRGETPTPAPVEEAQPVDEPPPPRVAMVAFDSHVANWDADVETDGLVIDVMPLDINRYLIPSSGTLEVELYAPQRRTLDLAPMSGGDTLELVERWTRAITPEDLGPSGARFRLPFGAITPELQPNWTASWYGLVHARLAIPGQGVFEDSRDGVRIRPWSPNRDRLEMKTGQRFLSTENLGRRE